MKRLQNKMLLIILVPTMLFFVGMTAYVSYISYDMATKGGEDVVDATGESLADELRAELEKPLVSVQTISDVYAGLLEKSIVPKREDANIMLQQLFEHNPNIISAWMFWERNAFDGKDKEYANTVGHDKTGRFIPIWSRTESGGFKLDPMTEYNTPGTLADNLNSVLQSGKSAIWEPMTYEYYGVEQLVTSIVAPVVIDGKTVGMTGVDILLQDLHKIVSEYTFYESGFAGLISHEGNVLSHLMVIFRGKAIIH